MHAWKKDKFTRSRRKRKGKGPVSHENASMGLKCMHEKPSFTSEFLIPVFMRQSEVGWRAHVNANWRRPIYFGRWVCASFRAVLGPFQGKKEKEMDADG